MIPPPPALLGLPRDDPSEFNLNQSSWGGEGGGGCHYTWMTDRECWSFLFKPRKANSEAFAKVSTFNDFWVDESLNITLLRLSQRHFRIIFSNLLRDNS